MKTPDVGWHHIFLRALEMTGNVRLACRTASITRSIAYEHYDKAAEDADLHPDAEPYSELRPYGDFHIKWDEAKEDACDRLEKALWDRAEKTDTTAAIFLLKAHRPHIYRETTRTEHANADDKPFETTTTIRTQADIELDQWREEQKLKAREAAAEVLHQHEPPPSGSG